MLYKAAICPVHDYGNIIYDACLKYESDAFKNVNVKQFLYAHTGNERLLNEYGKRQNSP